MLYNRIKNMLNRIIALEEEVLPDGWADYADSTYTSGKIKSIIVSIIA